MRPLMIVMICILCAPFVAADSPTFITPDHLDTYQLTEGEQIDPIDVEGYDVDEDYPLEFSSNAESPNVSFSCFSMGTVNDTNALINFTPTNDCVGYYEVELTVKDQSDDKPNSITVIFNVSNVNDAPNITGTEASPAVDVEEGTEVDFSYNYSASDPDLEYGDSLNSSWYLDRELREWSSPGNIWGHYFDHCSSGEHNVTLQVEDEAGAQDSHFFDVTIYDVNRPPELVAPIPDRQWPENTELTDNITLSEYLFDEDTECSGENKDEVHYEVHDADHVNVSINQSSTNVSFIPEEYWSGSEVIYFTANDSTNLTRSNNVTLNVTSVNDPPELESIPNQTTAVGARFMLNVSSYVFHPDDEELTYRTNSSIFNISDAGIIRRKPETGNVTHAVNVSVNDSIYTDWQVINITVLENELPSLEPIGNQSAVENELFEMTVNATDADAQDTINFSVEPPLLSVSVLDNSSEDARAELSFVPDDSETGNHTLTVWACDSKGACANESFNLSVEDVNNPPEWEEIPDQNPRVNFSYSLDAASYASDDDRQDTLTFSDNSTFFNISEDGMISFEQKEPITETVELVANDSYTTSATEVFFNVSINQPPEVNDTIRRFCYEDKPCLATIPAADPDGDTLHFDANLSALGNVSILKMDAQTGLINFTPNVSQVGNYTFQVNITDEYGGVNSTLLNLTINATNDPPEFISYENYTLLENYEYNLTVSVYDEEGDDISFWTNTSMFDVTSERVDEHHVNGRIDFTPSVEDIGNHSIRINASDGLNQSSVVVGYEIVNTSNPPEIVSMDPGTPYDFYEGNRTVFSAEYEDPDSIDFDHTWERGSIDRSTRNYSWQPDYCEAGDYTLTFNVTDESNQSDEVEWDVTVKDVNREPRLNTSIPNITLRKNEVSEVFDLDDFFYDPDRADPECRGQQDDNLTYATNDLTHATARINESTHVVTIIPDTDYVGTDSFTFTGSDGEDSVESHQVLLNITPNEAPNITAVRPYVNESGIVDGWREPDGEGMNLSVQEGTELFFAQKNDDPDGDNVSVKWHYDNNTYATPNRSIYFDYESAGNRTVLLNVSDGVAESHFVYRVTVHEVNRRPVFGRTQISLDSGDYEDTVYDDGLRLNGSGSYPSHGGFTALPVDFGDPGIKPRLGEVIWQQNSTGSSENEMADATLESVEAAQTSLSLVQDEDPATQWVSTESSDVLEVNLTDTYSIFNITCVFEGNTEYEVSFYEDGNYRFRTGGSASGRVTHVFDPERVRRLRFTLQSDNAVNVSEIYVMSRPAVFVRSRTSPDAESWSNWSMPYAPGDRVSATRVPRQNLSYQWPHRYLQLAADITTNQDSVTPSMRNLSLSYDIPDFVMEEDFNIQSWIDLDDYFSDPDGDALSYNVTMIANGQHMGVEIDDDGEVSLNPETDWYGYARMRFSACDREACEQPVTSNNATVQVLETPDPPPPPQSSGAGGSTTTERMIVPRPIKENVTVPRYMQLISPESDISTSKDQVVTPLRLKNGGNKSIEDINLSANVVGDANASLSFEQDRFERLEAGGTERTSLTVRMPENSGPFQVNVTAAAGDPDIRDSTMISITPMPTENLNKTVRFVRDLLSSNPECLELNAQLDEAISKIEGGQHTEAQSMLQDTVEACRYLMSSQQEREEEPSRISGMSTYEQFVARNKVPLTVISVVLGVLILVLAGIVIATKRYNRLLQQ